MSTERDMEIFANLFRDLISPLTLWQGNIEYAYVDN